VQTHTDTSTYMQADTHARTHTHTAYWSQKPPSFFSLIFNFWAT